MMMVTKSKTNNKVKENDQNGTHKHRSTTTELDHWAFLEEIEAPMWADLMLESVLTTEDNDDAWFHATHPFHQSSADKLRSAFSHLDVGNDYLNVNLHGVSTPRLPSSVSKSRGKDYRSRKWAKNCQLSLNKGHPVNDLSSKISRSDRGDSQPQGSSGNEGGTNGSITSLLSNISCTTTVSDSSQGMENDSDRRGVLCSESASTSEGVSTSSTITSESGQHQCSKVWEVSKEAFGHKGGLLNALKTNLRKSCATRPALRVEICDERESKGRISSSGKSSVGSSNLECDIKGKAPAEVQRQPVQPRQVKSELNVTRESKGRKSSFRNSNEATSSLRYQVKKMPAGLKQNSGRNLSVVDPGKLSQPVKGRAKASNLAKGSLHTRNTSNCRIAGQGTAAACTSQQAPKSKVLTQTILKNSSNQPIVKSQGIKGKVGNSNRLNASVYNGKENMQGRVVLKDKSDGKENLPGVRISDQKMPKLKSENKIGRTTSVTSKQLKTGRGNSGKLTSEVRVQLR